MTKTRPETFFGDIRLSRYDCLPPRFRGAQLRPQQVQMADNILLSGCGITVHSAPTGTGKSLAYLLPFLETGQRVAVLTATKALQSQLMQDFGWRGLACDIRGAANFDCRQIPGATCEDGGHAGCDHRRSHGVMSFHCPYMDQFHRAKQSRIIVSNYAMWFSMIDSGMDQQLGCGAVVADEAHLLVDLLTSAAAAEFRFDDLRRFRFEFDPAWTLEQWIRWAEKNRARMLSMPRNFASRGDYRSASASAAILRQAEAVLRLDGQECVREHGDGFVRFLPVWPIAAFRRYFRPDMQLVMASATINRNVCQQLGLRPGEYRYWEYESTFPPDNSPVYYSTGPTLNRNTPEKDWLKLYRLAFGIAEQYAGRRGIIYTASYERAEAMRDIAPVEASPAQLGRFLFHSQGKPLHALIEELKARRDAVLVSPAVVQGYDFPDDLCDFVVVVKCPYPDLGSPLVARRAQSAGYMESAMATALVQVCGRGVRHERDRCDCYVLDGALHSVLRRRPGIFPAWFRKRLRPMDPGK